uniref:DUF4211 domain-containing protein n=2 Tax=Haemonchus contortus TaxID=6289 RepID=A0A7I5E507_HAECO
MDDSAMDCSAPPADDGGKGRLSETKMHEEESQSPGKVTSKTDSQSTEEALDPDAADFPGTSEPTMDPSVGEDPTDESRDDVYFRPRSESPDVFRSGGHPSNLKSYDSTADGQQHNETAPTSPAQRFEHTYEIEDSRDEVRSESGGVRSRGRGARGRGRGGTRPCSGSATPLANSPLVNNDKKRAGRGRGSKRARGYGLSRGGDIVESETGSTVATSTADDVYEFKSSPESEFVPNQQPDFGNREERERSAPPSAKRQRLTEARPESHAGSAHSGDIEMDDIDEEEANSKQGVSDRKVPPLRISLPITQAEDDMHSEQSGHQMPSGHPNSNRKGPRGRHGKRHNDADEAQRMTRSKVRQTGKALDDTDAWTKKKRGRVNTTTTQGEEADESIVDDASPMAEGSDDTSPTGQASNSMSIPESLSSEQRIIYENPRSGMFHMKKLLAARWVEDLRKQHELPQNDNEKYKNMLLLTGDYSLRRDGAGTMTGQTSIEKVEPKTEHKSFAGTNSSSGSVANGEAESEDESTGLCPEMRALWREHNEERTNMTNRMYKERVKLRLFWEQELLRLEQREKGTTPAMSAVRFLRENEMCNAQILEEPSEPLKPMSRSEFTERKNKSISQMYNRHKMEASSLFGLQRDMWLCEARRRGLEVTPECINDCVPMVKAEKMDFPYS